MRITNPTIATTIWRHIPDLIISQRHRPLANEFVHGDPAWVVAHSQDCIGLPWLPDSNFVDGTTGRSVGDAPLRIRPTYMPTWR